MILHDPDTGKAVPMNSKPAWKIERDARRAKRPSKESVRRWLEAGGSRGIRERISAAADTDEPLEDER